MKKLYDAALSAAALLAAVAVAPAHAGTVGFTGPFSPANWTPVNTGNVAGGSVTFTPTTLTIVGQNDPTSDGSVPSCAGFSDSMNEGPCQIGTTISVSAPTSFNIGWSYSTADSGGAGFDIFGYIADGVFVALSDLGGAITQSGTASFIAGASLAFAVNCRDCTSGAATGIVTSFATAAVPLPEPATFALLGLGVVGVFASRKRRGGPEATA